MVAIFVSKNGFTTLECFMESLRPGKPVQVTISFAAISRLASTMDSPQLRLDLRPLKLCIAPFMNLVKRYSYSPRNAPAARVCYRQLSCPFQSHSHSFLPTVSLFSPYSQLFFSLFLPTLSFFPPPKTHTPVSHSGACQFHFSGSARAAPRDRPQGMSHRTGPIRVPLRPLTIA